MVARNYKREKAVEDAKGPARKKARAARNRATRIKKCPEGYVVDHKDGNPLNNSPSNLRCMKKSTSNKQGGSKGRKTNASKRTTKRKTS